MPADQEDEVFEVVDENNVVVGRQYRGVCHAQGIRHRAAYCFVFNAQGQLLLQQRSSRYNRTTENQFQSFPQSSVLVGC